MTVTELARSCGISRGTVLYYESIGLLQLAGRTESGYRKYGSRELERLCQIRAYRRAGLTLRDIRSMLNLTGGSNAAGVLRCRLYEIGQEICRLHEHQRAILALLRNQIKFRRTKDMTKDKWTAIMRSTGFSDDDMHRWHMEFEKAAPEEHEEFLAYLNVTPGEIDRIREWSRRGRP